MEFMVLGNECKEKEIVPGVTRVKCLALQGLRNFVENEKLGRADK